MARYVNHFPLNKDPQTLTQMVGDYLTSEGFEYTVFKGETVWKKGKGLLTAPQFVKLGFIGDGVVVEAWLKYALFPGVYVGEMGITGFFGVAMKVILKARVKSIEQIILS
ncbi:MAG: hypothetical protein BGN88_09205 [Clostridiales bacterium 43-6]|nr:MAG: hypothetical protein BGN88_09205 [Clostridiales bacterium 43-6]